MKHGYNFIGAIALLAVTFTASGAHAQLGNQTGIADPGRAQNRIMENMVMPQAAPDISVQQMQLQGAPKGSENIKFKFGGLRIEGANVYGEGQLAPLYRDQIGSEISLADVYDIANQMTLKYRNDGYILTQVVVPPQTIEGGIVRLRIVEGFIDRVSVQTSEREGTHALNTIKDYANGIKTGDALNIRRLERQLLLINDLPGVHARAILSPSKNKQGAADLLVIIDRDDYDALLALDNYGSRYLGPIQMSAAATLNSWIGLNDALTGQLVFAPGDASLNMELSYGALGYEMPVGPYGTKASVFASRTHTDPGYDLAQFDVAGQSNLYTVKVTHPFIRTRATNITGRVLFDWRDVTSRNDIEPTRHDNIRALRAGVQYGFLDRVLGVAFNVIDFEISQGLGVFGASEEGDANMTRAAGNPEFTKAEIDAQRLQRLTENVNLLMQARGQWSSSSLLSSEEFAVGGINSGRGYDPSEIVGDQGVSGKLELQWNNPGNLQMNYVEKYQLYGFYDAGHIWDKDPTVDDNGQATLTSLGGGVRMNFQSDTDAGLGVAFPLKRPVQTQGDAPNNRHPVLYVNISKKF